MFFHGRQLHTVLGVLEWLVTGIDEQRNGLEVAPQSQKPLQSVGSRSLGHSKICHVYVMCMLRYDRYVRIEEHCGCQQTTWSCWKGYQIDMPCMTRARKSPNMLSVGDWSAPTDLFFHKKTKQFQDVKQICAIHRSADRPFLSICHLPIVLFYEPMRPKPSIPVLPQSLNWCIHIYI